MTSYSTRLLASSEICFERGRRSRAANCRRNRPVFSRMKVRYHHQTEQGMCLWRCGAVMCFLSSRFPRSLQTQRGLLEAFRSSFRRSDQRRDPALPSVPQRPSRRSEPSVHGRHHLHLLRCAVTRHHLWWTPG